MKVKGQEKSELKVFTIQSDKEWKEGWESREESGGGWVSGIRSNNVAQIGWRKGEITYDFLLNF